jgi:hypothetical protein
MNLAVRTAPTAVVGLIVLGLIVFVPAGTLAYWQGWAFIGRLHDLHERHRRLSRAQRSRIARTAHEGWARR